MIDLPIKSLPVVAHVGEMDPPKKRHGSYEGSCLSVSVTPISWSRIARLGESGFILRGRGHFVDALALNKRQKAEIFSWAADEGLLVLGKVYRLRVLDPDTEEWTYTDFKDRAQAKREAEDLYEDEYTIRPREVYFGTPKLAEIAGSRSDHFLDESLSFDFVLIEYASRNQELDGVWWDETHCPENLSAPRGGIFPERISEFESIPANRFEFEELQERYLDGEMDLFPEHVSTKP